MTIWEAYETYRIMPNLRLHQMRVAALSRELARALKADHETVTLAGLLHDMGNIMKSDFSQFPPTFYGDQGIEYWQQVKKEFAERFGADEHAATESIAREIGVSEHIIELLKGMGFSKAQRIFNEGSIELQILEYADQRVAPHGIVSMEERLNEGHVRYMARERNEYGRDEAEYQKNRAVLRALEARLFEHLLITPAMFTEASLTPVIESLRDFEIA